MAFSLIITKSKPCSSASSKALAIGYTPGSIPSPTTRTSFASIFSLILC